MGIENGNRISLENTAMDPETGNEIETAQIYRELGLRRVINAADTYTLLGGGRLGAPITEAMTAASAHHIEVPALLEAVGSRIAGLLNVPAALPVNGAAAGLTIATAACLAGTDPGRVGRLPGSQYDQTEIVVLRCQRNSYDRAILGGGGTLVEVGYADSTPRWSVETAIGESTAGVMYYTGDQFEEYALPLEEVAELCRERNVPLIVDAAAQIPPVSNLWRYLEMGADLALFSGGKGLRGPQSSGLIVGREDLVRACAQNAYPHHSVGRAMKTSKENVMGLLAAIESALDTDWQTEYARWMELLRGYELRLGRINGLRTWITPTGRLGQTCPRLFIKWDSAGTTARVVDLETRLARLDPSVTVGYGNARGTTVFINPYSVLPEEEEYLIEQLVTALEDVVA